MTCSLCGVRKARRACPALGRSICAVCCGTKRLTEIDCPADCAYLSAAREHPPAATVRRQQQDVGVVLACVRDLSARQSDLFLLVAAAAAGYTPREFEGVHDGDLADAVGALAATYETAARGLIYEHQAGSLPAERLLSVLKPALAAAGANAGSAFERDAAVVLRRIESAARAAADAQPGGSRFLDLIRRMVAPAPDAPSGTARTAESGRLIVP